MTTEERRKRDPLALPTALARLARMRVIRAARETQEVQTRWDEEPSENLIEGLYLRRVRHEARDRDG